ncbi:MAG: hypothetical protein EON61_04340 [Alphaproteobacteria bacterium]|nr:MAG: hypothetical protein EON61_04340 [Alphaproteobacteria bacterium]
MLTAPECLLKANNFEIAAKMAPPGQRLVYFEQAMHWRRLAHEIQVERLGPFAGEDEPGGEPRSPNRLAPGLSN